MITEESRRKIVAAKRPAEIVREYIETRFADSRRNADVRLPTIHEFARELKVSTSTVSSVFKTLAAEGKIFSTPGRGTFLRAEEAAISNGGVRQRCIGINFSSLVQSSTEWWRSFVFNGVAGEALKRYWMISALGAASKPTANREDIRESIAHVDGVILLPSGGQEHRIIEICGEENKPVVDVTPSYFTSTVNFVSPDTFGFCYNLAQAWRQAGRRHPVLLLSNPGEEAVEEALVISAFQIAYARRGEESPVVLLFTENNSAVAEAGHRALKKYLKNCRNKPDAIFCTGDYIAEGALAAVTEAGLRVPDDLSVVGGTGLDATQIRTPALATRRQPMQRIGEEAVKMLLWRIENGSAPAPGVYFPSSMSAGSSLHPREREIFEKLSAERQILIPASREIAD